jgi:two-component system, NarL family, nitrate/nitrite response regulator NarL
MPQSLTPIKIMLIDDHVSIRDGLRILIEGQPNFTVVSEARNIEEARQKFNQAKPDLVLLDLDLRGESGLDLISEFTKGGARVLVLTGLRDQEQHQLCLRLGASGLVQKEQTANVLLKAIERVNEGEIWFDRTMMSNVLSNVLQGRDNNIDPETSKIAALTNREREVITLICTGLKNKQIAEKLFISDTTVRHHLTSIFSKLGVSDRLELVIYSYKHGLAKPPV